MANWLIVLLFAIGAVLVFVVAMSLTLLIKGRNIDSEISTNKNMQERGIRCAVQDEMTQRQGSGAGCADIADCETHTCGSCYTGESDAK